MLNLVMLVGYYVGNIINCNIIGVVEVGVGF